MYIYIDTKQTRIRYPIYFSMLRHAQNTILGVEQGESDGGGEDEFFLEERNKGGKNTAGRSGAASKKKGGVSNEAGGLLAGDLGEEDEVKKRRALRICLWRSQLIKITLEPV